ncbi:hypothetical protein ACFL17_04120 [Pseudomonadota bacterium]
MSLTTISARLFTTIFLFVAQMVFVSQLTADVSVPELKRGKGEQCVAPTQIMRRDHMKILLAQRDKVVLQGIRDRKHSLQNCISCHVDNNQQGQPIPVNAPGQFCQVCHTYSAVKIDCFECHLAVPDPLKSKNVQGLDKDKALSGISPLDLGATR